MYNKYHMVRYTRYPLFSFFIRDLFLSNLIFSFIFVIFAIDSSFCFFYLGTKNTSCTFFTWLPFI
jgi:hypothetical protein